MCINFVLRLSSLLRGAIITTFPYVHTCSCARQVSVVDIEISMMMMMIISV